MAKLAMDPTTRGYLGQPDFMQMLQMMQQNPQMMSAFMQDQRFQHALSVRPAVCHVCATPACGSHTIPRCGFRDWEFLCPPRLLHLGQRSAHPGTGPEQMVCSKRPRQLPAAVISCCFALQGCSTGTLTLTLNPAPCLQVGLGINMMSGDQFKSQQESRPQPNGSARAGPSAPTTPEASPGPLVFSTGASLLQCRGFNAPAGLGSEGAAGLCGSASTALLWPPSSSLPDPSSGLVRRPQGLAASRLAESQSRCGSRFCCWQNVSLQRLTKPPVV